MDIIFNARFFHLPKTGIGRYSLNLCRSLVKRDAENRYTFVLTRGLPAGDGGLPDGVRSEIIPAKQLLIHKDLRKTYWEQVQFPRFCRTIPDGIVHIPYIAPPRVKCARTILTVHDLAPLIFPLSKSGRKAAYDRLYVTLLIGAIRQVDFIIADSKNTRREVISRIGYPPEKIEVVHLAVEERFKPVRDDGKYDTVAHKYSLDREYIFYLGDSGYRKNITGLIHAYHLLSEDVKKHYDLVLCGNAAGAPRLVRMAEKLEGNRIKFIGHANDDDLPVLYSYAVLFVFPTRYEGFGLPPLEAMSCGTPVVTSQSSSLPEVVGEAGLLVDTTDVGEMSSAVGRLLADSRLRNELKERGLVQAEKFSWDSTAGKTLAIYEKVYRGS